MLKKRMAYKFMIITSSATKMIFHDMKLKQYKSIEQWFLLNSKRK